MSQLSDTFKRFCLGGGKLDGAERELSEELGLAQFAQRMGLDGVAIPLTLLEEEPVKFANEIALTDGDFETGLQPVTPRVFPGSDITFLNDVGITRVPVGQVRYPIITSGATATPHARGDAVANTDADFTVKKLDALRLSAQYTWQIEDNFQWGGALENSLRSDLRNVLSRGIDNSALNGSGSAPQPTGLFASFTTTVATDQATRAIYKGLFTSVIDGVYAGNLSGVRFLCGKEVYQNMESIENTNTEISVYENLVSRGIRMKVSANIGTHSSSKNQFCLRVTDPAAIVVPVWDAFLLTRDATTLASNARIKLTAHALHNVALLRTNGVAEVDVKFDA